jgi:hypothetical protein
VLYNDSENSPVDTLSDVSAEEDLTDTTSVSDTGKLKFNDRRFNAAWFGG